MPKAARMPSLASVSRIATSGWPCRTVAGDSAGERGERSPEWDVSHALAVARAWAVGWGKHGALEARLPRQEEASQCEWYRWAAVAAAMR